MKHRFEEYVECLIGNPFLYKVTKQGALFINRWQQQQHA